ncbi:hypothetical protein [Candidatus Regiella insecticola]|uniref:hypothetical protein n=1 Tax=Candidatus Regiella insecticola TaxID=138073 RepID=UPI001596B337|nr:hypothetical protein [Candidatus Regiella insecticola]
MPVALTACTKFPAWQNRIEHIVGSLEAGRAFDLCIYQIDYQNFSQNEYIFDTSRLLSVFSAGKKVLDN